MDRANDWSRFACDDNGKAISFTIGLEALSKFDHTVINKSLLEIFLCISDLA